MEKGICATLTKIQSELKAPKNQFNSFGNYKYRSCEDILEALKPILKEMHATVVISDEIVLIGDRYYVKATVTLKTDEGETSTSAYAREAQDKKSMDTSQITGATSSYARKYALNGLFLIDDVKDADTGKPEEKSPTHYVDNVKDDRGKLAPPPNETLIDDKSKQDKLYSLILKFNGGDKNEGEIKRLLGEFTTFKGKDGNMVKGVQSFRDLKGKRLDVTLSKVSKAIADNTPPSDEVF